MNHEKKGKHMPSASMVQDVHVAVLKWQVIETNTLGNRWVIAAFDIREHAQAFADAGNDVDSGRTYEVREDPKWVATTAMAREIRRSTEVHPVHEEVEP